MADPVTHLLWGYLVARRLSPDPRYLLLGTLAAVLPDVDALVPGLSHHGGLHTPLFAVLAAVYVWGVTRDRTLVLVVVAGLASHLAIDALFGGVMLLWPVSMSVTGMGVGSPAVLVSMRVFLGVIPAMWAWERWKATDEGPLDVARWVLERVPRPVTRVGMSTFGFAMVLIACQRFLSPLAT